MVIYFNNILLIKINFYYYYQHEIWYVALNKRRLLKLPSDNNFLTYILIYYATQGYFIYSLCINTQAQIYCQRVILQNDSYHV